MNVFVKDFVSQRVVMDGNVVKIGAYPLTGKTTLLQAIAMAGGIDPLADPTTVHVYRDKLSGEREVLTFDLLAIRDGKAADPLVKGNDTITVEKSAGKAFFQGRDRHHAWLHQLWPVHAGRQVIVSLVPRVPAPWPLVASCVL